MKKLRGALAAVLAAVMLICAFPFAAGAETGFDRKIAQLKAAYPEGMHWTDEDNTYPENNPYWIFTGCAGFAALLADNVFGEFNYMLWDDAVGNFDDVSNVSPGDVLSWMSSAGSHTVFVIGVKNNVITVAEGNYNSSIHWGRQLRARGTFNIYHYPDYEAGMAALNAAATLTPAIDPKNTPLRSQVDYNIGDLDWDWRVTAADARIALRSAVKLDPPPETPEDLLPFDADRDGALTSADARKILRVSVNLDRFSWYRPKF